MNTWKNIIVVFALLAAILPCSHAAVHHGHHCDVDKGVCGVSAEPCACHSCEHWPCVEKIEIQISHNTLDSATIESSSIPVVLFVLPEAKPLSKRIPSRGSGILATLQTVQLLI